MKKEVSPSLLVWGIHAVKEAVASARAGHIYFAKENRATAQILEEARQKGVPTTFLDQEALLALAPGKHQMIAAEIIPAPVPTLEEILAKKTPQSLYLLLDGVQDPQNLGACLRLAWAFGAEAVLVPAHGSAPLSAAARKAASGGAEHVPLLRVPNLAQAITTLKASGIWVYGASPRASQRLSHEALAFPCAWVLGGEGKGLRRLTEERCDALFSIPMSGGAQSLNVAMACAICLYETTRDRQ